MGLSIADTLALWLGTYWIHSSIILGCVWSFSLLRSESSLSLRETLWRVGLLAPIATTTLQVGGFASPLMGSITMSASIVAPVVNARDLEVLEQTAEEAGLIPGEPPRNSSGPAQRSSGVFGATRTGWSTLVVSLWLLGAPLMLLRALRSVQLLRKILADREVVVSGPIVDRAQRLAAIAGIPRVPRITLSGRARVPMALPTGEICLPSSIAHELTESQLDSVLAHELAHTERRDAMWGLLAFIMQSILFLQPLNRVARGCLADLAEMAADAWAVAATKNARSLAECLEIFASKQSSQLGFVPLPGIAGHSTLLVRVRRLLDRDMNERRISMTTKVWLSAFALTFAFVLPGVSAQRAGNAGAPEPAAPGAQVEMSPGQGANGTANIIEAVLSGDVNGTEALLLSGASANTLDSDGRSLLLIAIERDDLGMTELLLEAGANASFRDPSGDSPLHIAARRNVVSIFEVLLEAGADHGARNARGETPRHLTSSPKLLELLAEAGAR